MTQARLYGFSNADNRREATIRVRDSIAEHLVDVNGNDELFPRGIRGGIGFYRASSTGGYHLSHRPYEDVEKFIEHLGVREFEDHYVVGEEDNKFSDELLPVYASLCTECFEESNDAITDEEYRNGASPSHKLKYIICIIRTTDNDIPFVRFNNSISIHNLVVACYYSRVFWD